MLKKIQKILDEKPNVKAKDIAKKLGLDKHLINQFLYANTDHFQVDENYYWSNKSTTLLVTFPSHCWVDSNIFESALVSVGSPLESNLNSVTFIIPKGCKLLLESVARLMALSNQLVGRNKNVTLDFMEQQNTFSYVSRVGFFEHLDNKVHVLPARPVITRAQIYSENSDSLVEFAAIDPSKPDISIPKRLKNVFVALAGAKYDQDAYTVLSESFGNVMEHSKQSIPGFIGLQFYKNTSPKHIQTVISDSGDGILGTLKPIFPKKYPDLCKEIENSGEDFDLELLKRVFLNGRISQVNDPDRGLGLKSAGNVAIKYSAKISVRQANCEICLSFKQGELMPVSFKNNMPLILGTHICFDFELD